MWHAPPSQCMDSPALGCVAPTSLSMLPLRSLLLLLPSNRNSTPTPSDQETPPGNHSVFLDEEDTTPTETDFTTEEFEAREEWAEEEEDEEWEGEEDEFGTTI